jgi:hypothetical protein
MGRKLSIAALVGVLLVSGLLAGVSEGRGAGQQMRRVGTTVQLFASGDMLDEATKGYVHQVREAALDDSGARVGTIRWNCISGTDQHCTVVYALKGTGGFGRGTIVATGIFRGFNGERLAVTGGTGDYVGASGEVALSVTDGGFTSTVELTV